MIADIKEDMGGSILEDLQQELPTLQRLQESVLGGLLGGSG